MFSKLVCAKQREMAYLVKTFYSPPNSCHALQVGPCPPPTPFHLICWHQTYLPNIRLEGVLLVLTCDQRGRLDSLVCKDVFLHLQEELIPCYLLLEFTWVCDVELDTKLQGQSMRAWVMVGEMVGEMAGGRR